MEKIPTEIVLQQSSWLTFLSITFCFCYYNMWNVVSKCKKYLSVYLKWEGVSGHTSIILIRRILLQAIHNTIFTSKLVMCRAKLWCHPKNSPSDPIHFPTTPWNDVKKVMQLIMVLRYNGMSRKWKLVFVYTDFKKKEFQACSTNCIVVIFYAMGEYDSLFAKQAYFQAIHGKPIHLKASSDKITSVAIPLAFVGTTFLMMFRGMWNMSHGTGKLDWCNIVSIYAFVCSNNSMNLHHHHHSCAELICKMQITFSYKQFYQWDDVSLTRSTNRKDGTPLLLLNALATTLSNIIKRRCTTFIYISM